MRKITLGGDDAASALDKSGRGSAGEPATFGVRETKRAKAQGEQLMQLSKSGGRALGMRVIGVAGVVLSGMAATAGSAHVVRHGPARREMRWMTRLAGVLVGVFLVAGMLASVASAKATLHLYYLDEGVEREMAAEQDFEAYDPQWAIETPEGSVECTSTERNAGLAGIDESNNEKTDVLFVGQTFFSFYSNPSCTSTLAFTGTEAEGFWFNPHYSGIEEMYVGGELKLTAKETAEYRAEGKEDTVIEFRASGAAGSRCFYEVGKLKTKLNALPGSLRAHFNQQKVKLLKKNNSDARCPKKATVTTTMTLYTDTQEGQETSLYGRVS
jgi:hypothetical protein